MKYRFISAHRETFKAGRMCKLLNLSRSRFYFWITRPESWRSRENRALKDKIRVLHATSHEHIFRGKITNPKIRILILDDEPIVWKCLKPAFEKLGYDIETFTDSSKAMSRIRENSFDIVITDLKMKQISGMQFLTAIKEKSPHTEVIVITGVATRETAKESFQKGGFDFVAKPFKIGEIQEIVKKAEKKRAERSKGRRS